VNQKVPLVLNSETSIFNKSTTPSRKGTTVSGTSPLKSRRQESVILNENVQSILRQLNISNSSLQLTRKSHSSRETTVCQNHDTKVAKYIVDSDDETLPYCEKCAILLASQGFKVVRMESEPIGEGEDNNPLDLL
jgi:hypothetical protein